MRVLLDLELARDLAADSGLSDPDYDVLSTLTEVDDHRWRITELATHLRWSTSRLSHHIGRMEHRGLVHRESTAADGRGAMVALTDEGWRAIRAAAPEHVASVRRHFIDLLSPHEVATLEEVARKVVDHLTTDHGDRPATRRT
jgi:DNA-binding MarR family transcriptional regulator